MRFVRLAVLLLTACAAEIDGVWYGRHESAVEAGYEEILWLKDDGSFERQAVFSDDLGCAHAELAGGRYEWIGPLRVRFFVQNGRDVRSCSPRMDMNRPDMGIESYDREITADDVDCAVTIGETLFLECGASGWTNRCFAKEMPEEDCTPRATDAVAKMRDGG